MPGQLPPLDPKTPCQTWTGVFLVRRCGRPAVARCRRCGKAACEDHLRPVRGAGPPSFLCLDCLRPARDDERSWSTSGASGSSGSTRSVGPSSETGWSGAGGGSGGGGASGSWAASAPAVGAGVAAAAAAGSAMAEGTGGGEGSQGAPGLAGDPVFTEADYAAFAAMSDADKDEGGSSYDS